MLKKKTPANGFSQPHNPATVLNVTLFLLLLAGLSMGNLLSGDVEGVMPGENRLPQSQPSLSVTKVFSGNYTRLYDQYVADHFMLRNVFLTVSSRVETLKGLPRQESVQLVAFDGANLAQGTAPKSTPTDNETLSNADANPQTALDPKEALAAVENFGQLLVINDRAVELHRHNEEAIQAYAQVLNDVQAQLPHTAVFSMMVPTPIQFLEDDDYRSLSHDQEESVQLLEDLLLPEITSIHVFDALGSAPQDEIYFRTDHHWTARGAHLAYTAFMEQTQRQFVSLEAYELVEFDGFLGSLYGATRHEALAASPEVLEVFLPPGDLTYQVYPDGLHEASYESAVIDLAQYEAGLPFGVFLGGDQPLSVIQGSASNDRSILIVKDSYGNPFIPFLLPHYETIHVIDPRLTNENIIAYVRQQQVDEVLFLNYVLVTRYLSYVDLLKTLVY